MGDRYFVTVKCPKCKYKTKENEVYYAPTCNITKWTCPKCNKIIDLEAYTGISYEDASNRDVIEKMIKRIRMNPKK